MFIGILVYLLQILNLGVLFHFLLGYQLQKNIVCRICAVFMIATGFVVQVLHYDNMPPFVGIFFLMGMIVILPVIAFKGNGLRKLLLSVNFRCIYSALYGVTETLCNLCNMNVGNAVLLTQLGLTLLLGALSACVKIKIPEINSSVERMSRGLLLLLGMCLFVIDREVHVSTNETGDMIQVLIGYSHILSMTITMLLVVATIFIHWIREKNKELLYLNQLNQKYMEEQAKQYKNLEEKDLALRSFRHDYIQHLNVLQYYLLNARYEEASSYLTQLEEVKVATEFISTGNMIGDAVMNQYAELGKCNQIEFDYHGQIPVLNSVKETHFCALFANAVCNAYEAALQVEGKKIITIRVTNGGGYVFVSIKNPVAHGLKFYDRVFCTEKENKQLHGFGTKNMKKIAERYSGTISWNEEEGMVETKISIKYTE